MARGGQGLLIVIPGCSRLVEPIQTHRQVEGVVGIARCQTIGVEIGALGLRPTPLGGIDVPEREVQMSASQGCIGPESKPPNVSITRSVAVV